MNANDPTFLMYYYASQAHLRRSWPFHGGELLRLLGMLMEWKTTGAVGGEPREVMVRVVDRVLMICNLGVLSDSDSVVLDILKRCYNTLLSIV